MLHDLIICRKLNHITVKHMTFHNAHIRKIHTLSLVMSHVNQYRKSQASCIHNYNSKVFSNTNPI